VGTRHRAPADTPLAAGGAAWCNSSVAHVPPTDDRLDRDLVVLLDAALTAVADRLTAEQCAHLRERAGRMDLADHIKRCCSPEVQGVLLGERPHVNPDGGWVGEATGEPPHGTDGATVEEGSGKTSAIPTA
jgi:hypothetical protein